MDRDRFKQRRGRERAERKTSDQQGGKRNFQEKVKGLMIGAASAVENEIPALTGRRYGRKRGWW